MNLEKLKGEITDLADQHAKSGDNLDDIKDTDWLEREAFNKIVEFCKEKKLQVNGFPDSFNQDDEITDEHWMLYVDRLSLVADEVANLHWHWAHSFWPDQFKDQAELLEIIESRLSGNFYDVELK